MTPVAHESDNPGSTFAERRRQFRRYVRGRVTWGRVYWLTSYLKSALWTVPLIAIALELMLSPMIHALDTWQRWRLAAFQPAGATALYQTVITLALSFLVFAFGQLLVAIQIAGGQLTPRINRPEELALAMVPDRQGLRGSSRARL